MKFLRKLLLFFFDVLDEFFHQKRIARSIKSNKIKLEYFIDVGAFKGKYTDFILKIEKNCKVIMIEPQEKYYNLLKEKYNNNSNIEIHKIGISDKITKKNLRINKHEITSTFSSLNNKNRYLNLKAILFQSKLSDMTKNEVSVELFPLSEIIKEESFKNISLLKIDTEGHEFEVLYGAQELLKKVRHILIEFHIDKIYEDYDSEKIHRFLVENNFVLIKKFKFPFTTWEDRLYKNSMLEI